MYILQANCSEPIYSIVLYPLRNIFNIILIAAPILLMISLAIVLTKMIINPDNKKLPKALVNSIIATLLVFFISVFVNIVMMISGSKFTLTECWNSAKKPSYTSKYIDIYEDKKKKISIDPNAYQQGEKPSSSEADEYAGGSLPTNTSDRNLNARNAAVNWAVNIAADNTFHYGRQSWAHHNGCYFCGTNTKKGSIKRKDGAPLGEVDKTYCCNPFVTAAFHHGAGTKEVDCKKGSKRINLANDSNPALENKKAFKRIAKPSKVTQLEPGDVLLTPSHAMLYAGGGKVAEAAHHDNGKKDSTWNDSIRVKKLSSGQWSKVSKIYRYIGTGKF